MPLPSRPSLSRRVLLAPLSLAYGIGSALHRALWLRPARGPAPATPLWVIGSLRAGGAGKTAVTLELARRLTAAGRRVGILVYRIAGNHSGNRDVPSEVFPDSDWRESSDEAVLLARASGARVFATRRRDLAWRRLAARGDFDVLLSDDGLMDARLRGAVRIVLARPQDRPRWSDLLPAGAFRLTARALEQADHVWFGPLEPAEAAAPGFVREIVLPENLDLGKPYWALCGLGNPEAFVAALRRAGVRLAGATIGRDHALPDLARARRDARRAGAAGFLYSAKDAIKLEGRLLPGESAGRVDERVRFQPEPPDLPGLRDASRGPASS